MTTDELNAIVQAVMTELEKAGVDFDFKAEVPQPTDLVYVMRGTADRYQGITVKWQNLLDIIVQKATEARDDAISAKDIALQTLATIQGIESNISTMKTSVETTKSEVETLKSDVATMKASVETSEVNVTQMKSDVSEMKTSVEGTKTEVENIKKETAGLLDTKVNKTDSLSYEEIMATNPVPDLTGKVASASALNTLGTKVNYKNTISQTDFTSLVPEVTIGSYARCIRFGNYFSIILPISISSTVPAWTKIVQVPISAASETMGLLISLSAYVSNNALPLLPSNNKVEITVTLDAGEYFLYFVGAVKQ